MVDEPVGDVHPTITIDGEQQQAEGPLVTGAELLALVGRDAARFDVFAEGHHGRRIGSRQTVPVQDGGRFVTKPKDEPL